MAVYAVGDIQGCYDPLARLLERVNFDQAKDTLWCVGDLVNRGPQSLETLNLLKSLEKQCVTVLGNHDFHLLAMLYGVREPRRHDTVNDILNAPNASELAHWLRSKPLLHKDTKRRSLLCHAGIYPWWSVDEALSHSSEIEGILKNEKSTVKLLKKIYGNSPNKWSSELGSTQRRRFIINAFTRMRFVSRKGRLNFSHSGYDGLVRKNRLPWFEIENPHLQNYRVIFGHWSALGFRNSKRSLCLDTGYVWGRHLTMVKLPKKAKDKKLSSDRFFISQNPNSLKN